MLKSHDLLLLPTAPMKATPIPGKDASPQEITRRSWEATRNTCPFNVTGHPAISIPCGMEDGRPIGVMLVGAPLERGDDLPRRRRVRALGQLDEVLRPFMDFDTSSISVSHPRKRTIQ